MRLFGQDTLVFGHAEELIPSLRQAVVVHDLRHCLKP